MKKSEAIEWVGRNIPSPPPDSDRVSGNVKAVGFLILVILIYFVAGVKRVN